MIGYTAISMRARFVARNCRGPSEAQVLLAACSINSEYGTELARWLHAFGYRISVRFAAKLRVKPHPARPKKNFKGYNWRQKRADKADRRGPWATQER